MKSPIQAALKQAARAGGMNLAGRLLTLANTGFKSPFSRRPKSDEIKGGLNPHVYWLQAALDNTTSLRTYRLLGRLLSGRKWMKKVCEQNQSLCNGRTLRPPQEVV